MNNAAAGSNSSGRGGASNASTGSASAGSASTGSASTDSAKTQADKSATLDIKQMAKLSNKIINDPIMLRKLGDRIYSLMQEDIINQCDRNHQSRRFYS